MVQTGQEVIDVKQRITDQSITVSKAEYNTCFTRCNFKVFKPANFVDCQFINCSFPDDMETGKLIFNDSKNTYSKCNLNINGIIKELFEITNGVSDIINSINWNLNKKDTNKQVADIGKVNDKRANSFIVEL